MSRFSAIATKRAHHPQTHAPEAISRNCSRLLLTCRTAIPHNSGLLLRLAGNYTNDDQNHNKKAGVTPQMSFCCTGAPDKVWTDQGPQFTSQAFQKFTKQWGFKHVTSSPRYTQNNGKAEATVKSMKKIGVDSP